MAKRVTYGAASLAAIGLAVWLTFSQSVGWWIVAIFALAPDLTLLGFLERGLAPGQLSRRAVPFYNAVHRFWAPAVVLAIGLVLRSPSWMVAGLTWIAHIALDRSLGFGLRTPDGLQRGHPGALRPVSERP